ncbi:methyl-accepting chemotaxis protein [Pseudomonas lalucatii]|uniref:Methyl-accepting chemotaxis protein n=1 Tax=Pseudomonas lalucatii TaxID=1424203 RepID=A0ABS5PVT6_9PSED|nr:methyl-accepting chemotaxis protein [Pseudomonas lalucatii]MBS7660636.1 methyl-accepting chemotaxis protein [Pseudomonas lalucatii]MBS7724539.1 methyl-accepting chemotaxis protein [Pseudomonas lalucatii]QVM87463.1 methyl-accepting chemotaxis protein [Pseudomonas lalucatii]
MDRLVNLSIGSKLIAAFALLIGGFGFLQFSSLERFVGLQENEERQFQQHYGRVADVKDLRLNIAAQRNDLLTLLNEEQLAELDNVEQAIDRRNAENERLVRRLQQTASEDQEFADLLEELLAERAALAKTRAEQLKLLRAGALAQARQLSSGVQLERLNRIHELGVRLSRVTDRRVAAAMARSSQILDAQRERTLRLSLLLVGVSALLAWLLSHHIARPLARLTGWAERIGRGEIPQEMVSSTRRDEVGRLTQAFADMGQYLRELVREMNEGIGVLASSSEEILAAASQVATSTQETATAISEIVTTVEEVKQTAVLAGSKSKTVAESTERTRQVAQNGRQAVDEALKGMGQIREQMQAVAESIMRLGEQSQAIGEIVASVGDLAEQSNLLGVNASIEAMKAGEAGKGFSVVAQEVKALADQSKQATTQVRGILGEIQKAMTKAVLLAEQGSKTVESGFERAQSSGDAIRSLSSNIETSSEVALQIAATSQQQMIGMDQIASAMANIRQASQDNVGGTQQVDLAARNLHQLGLKLQGLASRFRL